MSSYLFHYKGQRSVYQITVSIAQNSNVSITCSCGSRKSCKHIQNLLIGRYEKIPSNEAPKLTTMLEALSQSPQGIQAMESARFYFQSEDRCRRCNSKNIVDTKDGTFKARLYGLISKHRHYCRDCKWSW